MEKYGNIPGRTIGQIWDSVANSDKTVDALPFAFFPNNKLLETLMRAALRCHLFIYRPLQPHYTEALNNYLNHIIRAPALIFASKTDFIGTEEYAERIVKNWRSIGIDVTYKCFEKSPHVKHYQTYPEEYLKYVHEHWKRTKLLERK